MVERRVGGETGVKAVTCLEGDGVWQAAKDGVFSRELAEAACACIDDKPAGSMEENCATPALFVVEYCDGLKGAILMLRGYVNQLAYAARVDGEIPILRGILPGAWRAFRAPLRALQLFRT